jgi:ATP-dependent DNA helicase PIF1
MVVLNPAQEEAFKLVKEGHSICMTGAAGSGKSFMINHILHELQLKSLETSKSEDSTSTSTASELVVVEKSGNLEITGRRRIAVTALTGIASTYINGMTLHSWAGIPVRQTGKAQILKGLLSATSTANGIGNKAIHKEAKEDDSSVATRGAKVKEKDPESDEAQIVKRWQETDLLIIDEVSMMSAEVLNKLDYLGRHIRNVNKPLGGLQLVLSGDFCQLPPIGTNERYCFESQVWKEAITKTFALKQIVRQSDPALQAVLNEVREGKITMAGKELLNSRLISNLKEEELALIEGVSDKTKAKSAKPTLIYPHREKVNDINRQKFEELVSIHEDYKIFTYTYADTMSLKPAYKGKVRPDIPEKELEEFIDQHCTAEKDLHLCVGCQVMLTVNLNLEEGLVNGLTGIICGFEDGLPLLSVTDTNNPGKMRTVKIDKWTWIPDHPRYLLKRVQIPLILAWAITVHRSQGATLSSARADLKEAFGPGMAYVILSRIKTLSGLYLEGINYSKIKCDPRVLAFYKAII